MPQQPQTAAVTAAAAYFPAFTRGVGRGTVPVCNGDEDAITLAVSAGLACVPAAARPIEQIFVVLGHSPLQAGPIGEVVREALSLAADIACTVMLGDELGGLNALLSAIDQVSGGRAGSVLVVVAEAGDGRRVGASAVALLVELPAERGGIAISKVRSEGAVVYGTWSAADGTSGRADPRFLDAARSGPVGRLLDRSGLPAAQASALAVSGDLPAAIRDELPPLLPIAAVGECGVTGPVLALLAGARLAAGGLAAGRLDAGLTFLGLFASPARTALVEASISGEADWLPETRAPETALRAPEPAAAPELSLPTSSPFFARSARELLRLEAGRCDACGHIAFPPAQRPICATCGGSGWTSCQIARAGAVYTFTVNRFLPDGFGQQMVMILGEMTDGNRYWAPASGIAGDEVRIGLPVELSVRRYTQAGGAPVYGMKFTSPRDHAAFAPASR